MAVKVKVKVRLDTGRVDAGEGGRKRELIREMTIDTTTIYSSSRGKDKNASHNIDGVVFVPHEVGQPVLGLVVLFPRG